MKVRAPSPSLAMTQRGEPIRTVNADIAAAELDADSEESRALFKKPGARVPLASTPGGAQNRSPIELADFFGARMAEQLASDPDARVAKELLHRRDKALRDADRQRPTGQKRVQRYRRRG